MWVEDEAKLKELSVRHFSETFKDEKKSNIVDQLQVIKLFPTFLSENDSVVFTSMISLSKVEDALKSFKKDRILGPDG